MLLKKETEGHAATRVCMRKDNVRTTSETGTFDFFFSQAQTISQPSRSNQAVPSAFAEAVVFSLNPLVQKCEVGSGSRRKNTWAAEEKQRTRLCAKISFVEVCCGVRGRPHR